MIKLNQKIFEAYDIRGKYPNEINERVVFEIILAIQRIFYSGAKKIVVGHDARLSSPALYQSVLKALKQNSKLKILEIGLTTTPMIYFLVNKLKAAGGIIVTASHNPKEYNGLKIVRKGAVPISGRDILNKILSFSQAASFAPAGKLAFSSPRSSAFSGHHARSAARLSNKRQNFYLNSYRQFLKRYFKITRCLTIIFDCSNGTTGIVLKELFKDFKFINPIFINDKPDGYFSAHGPNPLVKNSTRQLQAAVKKHQVDLGVIFDADGDRVFFVDNQGKRIDPDDIALLLTSLFGPPYIITSISSWKLKRKNAFISKIGHYYMKQAMRQKKANLGMERSGHYYFKEFFNCESGILAAIFVINVLSESGQKLSELIKSFPKYYRSEEINIAVTNKKDQVIAAIFKTIEHYYQKTATAVSRLDGLTMEFDKNWHFNIRRSGSENYLRINIEAVSKKLLTTKKADLLTSIRAFLLY